MEINKIYNDPGLEIRQSEFISKVYGWMCAALLVTALVAWAMATIPGMAEGLFRHRFFFWGILIAQFGCVIGLSGFAQRLTTKQNIAIFLGYAVLNGLTFSFIFLLFTFSSIMVTFFITAFSFGVMSYFGYVTKQDLTTFGNILKLALLGLVIATVANIFFSNESMYWITTYAGVLIFVGLIAYDTQKLKAMHAMSASSASDMQKTAILGALSLYLDFINLFLYLLRLFGRRK